MKPFIVYRCLQWENKPTEEAGHAPIKDPWAEGPKIGLGQGWARASSGREPAGASRLRGWVGFLALIEPVVGDMLQSLDRAICDFHYPIGHPGILAWVSEMGV